MSSSNAAPLRSSRPQMQLPSSKARPAPEQVSALVNSHRSPRAPASEVRSTSVYSTLAFTMAESWLQSQVPSSRTFLPLQVGVGAESSVSFENSQAGPAAVGSVHLQVPSVW